MQLYIQSLHLSFIDCFSNAESIKLKLPSHIYSCKCVQRSDVLKKGSE